MRNPIPVHYTGVAYCSNRITVAGQFPTRLTSVMGVGVPAACSGMGIDGLCIKILSLLYIEDTTAQYQLMYFHFNRHSIFINWTPIVYRY